ncbi:MAG: hypothetical protein JXR40_02245 [Pontiellaceae bacterium]|nr:hypothetical protein [Pontiellaceae bacterium]
MKKKPKAAPEYGKPYTPKDFRDVGIGLLIAGIIVTLCGASSFIHGAENQLLLTKVGNVLSGSDPHNPLSLAAALVGSAITITGLLFWIRGKRVEKQRKKKPKPD